LVLLAVASSASAVNSHYQYEGSAFLNAFSETPPNGAYTLANRVSGVVTLDGPLAPNLTFEQVDDHVLGFRFDDGRGVLDETTAALSIFVSTDENGVITQWDVEVKNGEFPDALGEQTHLILAQKTPGNVGDEGSITECVNELGCQPLGGSDFKSDWAYNNIAGTFPEPGSAGLFCGVGALAWLARKRGPR
jgi:hypothetical protein